MRKEFNTDSAKFVYTKNELCYQEVLDAFPSASKITIITYNISEKNNQLINALIQTSDECIINIVTNVPGRWEYYYKDTFKDKARQKIHLYLTKLKPEQLGSLSSVFFDFSNHGKIIMTDSILFVGSANFSEESANNTEFGFVSTDKSLIEFISTEVLSDVKDSAIPYYEYDYSTLLYSANLALSAINHAKNELHEEIYNLNDEIAGEWFYYNKYEANLSVQSLDRILNYTNEACSVAREMYDAIDTITEGDEDETTNVNDIYERLYEIYQNLEELRYYDTIVELSEFDPNKYTNDQLQYEYAMEADEEHLQEYVDKAISDAAEKNEELSTAAEDDLECFISKIDSFCKVYSSLLDNLHSRKLKKVNSRIDNT